MRRRLLRGLWFFLAWLVVALPAWAIAFTHSSSDVVVASHDAVVHPTLDGWVRIDMGPYVPDLRTKSQGCIGVVVVMEKTNANSTGELVQRYAAMAARPGAEERRITSEVVGLARDSALRAAGIGLIPIGVWMLVGHRRRKELWRRVTSPDWRSEVGTAATAVALAGAVALLVTQPWRPDHERVSTDIWLPVQDALPDIPVPQDLQHWQVQGGLLTSDTRRLIASAFDSYDRSKVFFTGIKDKVPTIKSQLRPPAEGETLAVLVSDRHDNIGMDPVVRRVADAAGATVVLDAGDDTSTGETWEEFSLDSLDKSFDGYDHRVFIEGNHDNGSFVKRHLSSLGWTHLTGKPIEPFADVRLTGVDDPRSSGLGSWRDATGLSFDEVEKRIADDVCELDQEGERIATLIVHDANLGRTALARGCTDLVLAGHLHRQVGPTRIVGENGKVGYSYTNGTTGGAAYAIALGSKLRRDAEFTFVTYKDGRPVGIQPVTVTVAGSFSVAPYQRFDFDTSG
jgi:hypothetical protein